MNNSSGVVSAYYVTTEKVAPLAWFFPQDVNKRGWGGGVKICGYVGSGYVVCKVLLAACSLLY